jgi:hypothetical protein
VSGVIAPALSGSVLTLAGGQLALCATALALWFLARRRRARADA